MLLEYLKKSCLKNEVTDKLKKYQLNRLAFCDRQF